MDRRQHAFIAEQFKFMGGSVVWNFCFRRNLTDIEASDPRRMFVLFDEVYLSLGKPDVRLLMQEHITWI